MVPDSHVVPSCQISIDKTGLDAVSPIQEEQGSGNLARITKEPCGRDVASFSRDVYNGNMAEEEKKAEDTTTVLVREEGKKKGAFSGRLVLIYLLLLASGLFLGILFAYLFRR